MASWLLGLVLIVAALVLGRLIRVSVDEPSGTPESNGRPRAAESATTITSASSYETIVEEGDEAEVTPAPGVQGFGVSPAPEYYPRDPSEWQGRLVNISIREPCNDEGSCGRARACRQDRTCGPCTADRDCLDGEACVLNNCLLKDKVECRSRADCGSSSVCMIVGDGKYGRRGNEGLNALCSDSPRIGEIALQQVEREAPRSPAMLPPEPDLVSPSRLEADLAKSLGIDLKNGKRRMDEDQGRVQSRD